MEAAVDVEAPSAAFDRAIRELRERREREHEFDRNQKKAPADTVVP